MKKIFVLFLIIFTSSCVKNDPLNQSFNSITPKNIGDGHIISTPTAENMDSLDLIDIYEGVYADDNLWSLRSLLVFRNGKLVAESYLKADEDIINRHIVWSCTKQVMGVLTGIALEQGVFESLDDPISEYLDDELNGHEDKTGITLRNLVTMQSGIDYNNDTQTDDLLQQKVDNSVDFILSRSIVNQQGEVFHYNDGNPHLISAMIQSITNKPADVWADEVLFSKLGMVNYNWVRYKDGVTLGGFGIETTPRELAKVALCVSDSGQWRGISVVPSSWISEMTTMQVNANESYDFGYFWWIDKKRTIPFMWGVGGQFAFIVPDKNLVVIMTSFPNTAGEYEIQADEALPIVDLIIDAAD